jgi:4a-hydroxytetrahydrobiopterin dehydratase
MGKTDVLTGEELDAAVAAQPGWRLRGQALERELAFRDFEEALRFVARVGQAAVDYQRRPDMCISEFNRVRLTIANPHHAGLTEAETRLMGKVNAILDEHHPDHPEARR